MKGSLLKSLRTARGMSRAKLAAVSGLSYEGIRKLEKEGEHDPEYATLQKLSGALDVSIPYLKEGRESLQIVGGYPALQEEPRLEVLLREGWPLLPPEAKKTIVRVFALEVHVARDPRVLGRPPGPENDDDDDVLDFILEDFMEG